MRPIVGRRIKENKLILLKMINFSDVYLYTDQPTTCPQCGSRTYITLDLSHTIRQTQIHKCLFKNCRFEFVMQTDL